MLRRRFLTLAAAATAAPLAAARSADPAPAALRDDIAIVRAALSLHPGLHRYATPPEMEARLRAFEDAFAASTTLEGRYLLLSRFLAAIRCGHSYCNFFNQSDAVRSALFERSTALPFQFRWIGGQMIVTRDPADLGLPPGSQIETIDSRPAGDLLKALTAFSRADGGNDGKRRAWLSVQGREAIEAFDVFQGLLYPPTGGAFRLSVRLPDGRIRRMEAAPAGPPERRSWRRAAPNDGTPIWTWEQLPDGIAVLTMPDWAMYNKKWTAWRIWLAERLESLRGARALIVDIRACEGGNDCGDEILARITDRDLTFPAEVQKIRFRTTPAALDPYLDTWDDSFRTLGQEAVALPDGFYARPGAEAVRTIAAATPKIDVPVAALIGPVNSSATFQFARSCRKTGLVRLFGAETGGNLRGINGGCFFFVRLPASGLEFDLPLVGYFPATPQPDSGVPPDVAVPDDARDVAVGRDPTMDAALEWARRV